MRQVLLLIAAVALQHPAHAQQVIQADDLRFSEVVNGSAEHVSYLGRRAVRIVPAPAVEGTAANILAILPGITFHNGTIDVDVAGKPRPGMPADARGFVGLSFRAGEHGEWSEVFYLRPTNGRADDQLRRNHSVQYTSDPEYTWHRLRDEHPGTYESNVDLETGVWTHLKIVVAGTTARLYVNNAPEPSLVVTDLKRGDISGRIALWSEVETDAYFGALKIQPSPH